MNRVLEELFPIMEVEDHLILSKGGDVTIGFVCHLPEIFTLSAEEYEALHQVWIRAVKVLPKHTVLHKQVYKGPGQLWLYKLLAFFRSKDLQPGYIFVNRHQVRAEALLAMKVVVE